MNDELPKPKKQAELIDLAARLDKYGVKMLGPETHATTESAARILATPGAAMNSPAKMNGERADWSASRSLSTALNSERAASNWARPRSSRDHASTPFRAIHAVTSAARPTAPSENILNESAQFMITTLPCFAF